jgi:hypothetical protein
MLFNSALFSHSLKHSVAYNFNLSLYRSGSARFASTQVTPSSRIPGAASFLGVAGLIPFVASTASLLLYPYSITSLLYLQSAYGCSILSFMGGVHWGLAMANYGNMTSNTKRYALSVLPSLLGFSSLLVPHLPIQLLIQGAGFASLVYGDYKGHQKGLVPPWYIKLRVRLTLIVLACISTSVYTVWDSQ